MTAPAEHFGLSMRARRAEVKADIGVALGDESAGRPLRALEIGADATFPGERPKTWSFTSGLPILCLMLCLQVDEKVRNIDWLLPLKPSLT
jgi:hypothetical protein